MIFSVMMNVFGLVSAPMSLCVHTLCFVVCFSFVEEEGRTGHVRAWCIAAARLSIRVCFHLCFEYTRAGCVC